MEASPDSPGESQPPFPSLGRANRIYLLVMLSIIVIAVLMPLLPAWRGVLELTTGPLIALITLWAVRSEKRPMRQALRLNWPGWCAVGLGVVIGLCAFTVSMLAQGILSSLTGQSYGEDLIDLISDPNLMLLFIASGVILAPLCEDIVFRGYLLGIYERYLGPKASLWLVSALFAAAHMSLFGGLSLLPGSLLLTYLVLRTGSLTTSIVAHLTINGFVPALFLLMLYIPMSWTLAEYGMIAIVLLGPVLLLFAWRRFNRALPVLAPPQRLTATGSRLGRIWPLVVAGLIFAGVGGLEIVDAFFPLVLSHPLPALTAPAGPVHTRLVYDMMAHMYGREEALTCTQWTENGSFQIDCDSNSSSGYPDPADKLKWSATWDEKTMQLQSAHYVGERWSAEMALVDGNLIYHLIDFKGESTFLSLPANALIDTLWPWQLAGLPFEEFTRSPGTWVQISKYDGILGVKTVVVEGKDKKTKITISGQEYTAWQIEIDKKWALYDTQPPHTLLQFTWYGSAYTLRSLSQ